jgi:hypothetical protein
MEMFPSRYIHVGEMRPGSRNGKNVRFVKSGSGMKVLPTFRNCKVILSGVLIVFYHRKAGTGRMG